MRPRHFVALVTLCGTVALAGWGAAGLSGFGWYGRESAATPIGDRETTRGATPLSADAAPVDLASVMAPVAAGVTSRLDEPPEPAATPAAMSVGNVATGDPDPPPEPAFALAGVSANDVPAIENPLPASRPMPPPDPVKEDPSSAVRPAETPNECLVAETCIDEYLWSLYERAPKVDTTKVVERIKVTVERKGKTRTVTKTVTKLVDQDFAWKDPAAAQKAGMSLMDYVIGGMDRRFKLKLYRALRAMDDAGLSPGITSGFRDDYRQSLASGLRAATDSSYHGGSRRGGYGHGLAADIVSVKGETRSERWRSSEDLWKWIDVHEEELGIGRPYLNRDPPHVGPIDGKEYADKRGQGQNARLETKKRRLAAGNDPGATKPAMSASIVEGGQPSEAWQASNVEMNRAQAVKPEIVTVDSSCEDLTRASCLGLPAGWPSVP